MPPVYVDAWKVELGLGRYSSVVLADSPVGYWRLDETSGTTAADSSGNTRNGTYSNAPTLNVATTRPDRNPAITLASASSQYVTMGDVAAFEFTGAFTAECWAKWTTSAAMGLATKALQGSAKGWGFFIDLSGNLRLLAYTSAGAAVFDVTTTGLAKNDGLWHHLVATWDGTTNANGIKFYVDGAVYQQFTASAGTPDTNAAPFAIGSYGDLIGNFLNGSIDEVAVYGSALSATRITAHYLAGVWTNVTADVVDRETIRWTRGQAMGASPKNRTPRPGILSFALQNDALNSGGLQGYYAPNNANNRTGFTYGIPVRLVVTYSGTDYPLWTGKLRTIDPEPGQNRKQRTYCTAQDVFGDLTEATAREITAQLGQTEVALMQAVLAAVSSTARPVATSYDSALDSFTYALDNIGEGAAAIGLLNDIAVSAQGWIFGKADGTFTYENRHTRALKASSYTLSEADGDDLLVPSALNGVYNRIRVRTHPKTITAATLYASTGALAVGGNQTITVWGAYADPNNKERLIGGSAFTTPLVAGTDYVGNSAADGGGSVMTSNLTVTVTPFATTAKFVITNTSATTVYVTTLQLRGSGIFDNAPQTFESFVAMDYGDQSLDVDLKYQDNANVGQDLADYLKAVWSNPIQADAVAIKANRSTTLMTQALTRDIGDVVTLGESVTGISALNVAISGVEGEIVDGSVLRLQWNVEPQSTMTALIFDDSVYGVFDAADAAFGYA